MNGIYYYLIAFIAIWLVALLFKKQLEKFGVDVNFPVLMWKTTRLRGFIDRLANISPRFWKWYMNVGIVVSFIGMITILYFIINSLSTITTTPSVSIIIPGVEVPGSPIFIPFFYGIIGLVTVLVVHEFSHGILTRVEKLKVKSIGLLLFAILPGAFVEPDEEEIKKASRISRMRVYAAGSIANMSLAIIALAIAFLISNVAIAGTFHEDGIKIDSLVANSPSTNILESGMVIKEINGVKITNISSYMAVASNIKPQENITISTNQGNHIIQVGTNPQNNSRGYMGLHLAQNYGIKKDVSDVWGDQAPWALFNLFELFHWIFLLNISVGLFNLLPISMLDGGHLLRDLLRWKLSEKVVKPVTSILSYFLIIIIVISIGYGLISGL